MKREGGKRGLIFLKFLQGGLYVFLVNCPILANTHSWLCNEINGPPPKKKKKKKKKHPVKEVKLAVDFLVDRNTGLEHWASFLGSAKLHKFEQRCKDIKYVNTWKPLPALVYATFTVYEKKVKISGLNSNRTHDPLWYRCSALPAKLSSQLVIVGVCNKSV